MIQVTLTFTSLHAAVRGLSEIPADLLVGEGPTLTLADAQAGVAGSNDKADIVRQMEPAAAQVEKPKATSAATPAATDAPAKTAVESSPTAAPAAAEPPPSTAAPDRATVSKAAVALAMKDKPKIIEILASFGAKAAKELTEDQLTPALAAINAAIAGV